MRGVLNMSVFILAGCMVAVVLSAVLIGYSYGAASVPPVPTPTAIIPVQNELPSQTEITTEPDPEPEPEPTEIILDGSIAIRGFEKLTAENGVIHSSGISNPSKNECYFIVSIIMPDGSIIYNSGILAPSQELDEIELSKELESGIYEGVIARYSSYALDTMQPLNGADITFILEVLP